MKRFSLLAIIFALFLAFLPGNALADTKVHEESGIQLDIPAGWNAHAEGDELIIDHESGVAIIIDVIDGDDLMAAIEAIDDELAELDSFELVGEPSTETINGLSALIFSGIGTVEGEKIEVGVALIDAPKAGKIMVIVGLGTPDALKGQAAAIDKFVHSIKPAN
jgi:predicted Zn-dependent protease